MKIVLAGGSGYLGRPLASRLSLSGHEVIVLTRNLALGRAAGGLRYVTWNPDGAIPSFDRESGSVADRHSRGNDWSSEIDGADVVVNLGGAGIADERWTVARKQLLVDSRIRTTQSLLAAMAGARVRPRTFVQASGIGYYGTSDDDVLDETSPPGDDFLARLCINWEAEGHRAVSLGARVVIIRTGIVLSVDGGALKQLLTPFRLFVGGRLASGRQYMSWIHLHDWISLVTWAIETSELDGVVNATAPRPITNAAFSKALGRATHRPSWLPVPARALRIIVGEMADIALIGGQRVMPRRALDQKFGFRYPDIELALKAALAPSES